MSSFPPAKFTDDDDLEEEKEEENLAVKPEVQIKSSKTSKTSQKKSPQQANTQQINPVNPFPNDATITSVILIQEATTEQTNRLAEEAQQSCTEHQEQIQKNKLLENFIKEQKKALNQQSSLITLDNFWRQQRENELNKFDVLRSQAMSLAPGVNQSSSQDHFIQQQLIQQQQFLAQQQQQQQLLAQQQQQELERTQFAQSSYNPPNIPTNTFTVGKAVWLGIPIGLFVLFLCANLLGVNPFIPSTNSIQKEEVLK